MTGIILASSSAARRLLLAQAGIVAQTNPPDVDEAALKAAYLAIEPDLSPAQMAARLAAAKAVSVSNQRPECLVIGADQVLSLGSVRYDKPTSMEDARRQLKALRGQTHHLETAIACARNGALVWSAMARPALTMRAFSDEFLETYLQAMGDSVMQTVGGYKLEGEGIQLFQAIEGDYFSILGVPLMALLEFLRAQKEIGT